MTHEEHEEMTRLCQQIAVEQDRQVFQSLIQRLNDLLSRKAQRFEEREQRKL